MAIHTLKILHQMLQDLLQHSQRGFDQILHCRPYRPKIFLTIFLETFPSCKLRKKMLDLKLSPYIGARRERVELH